MANGVGKSREVLGAQLNRDTRPIPTRILEFLVAGDTWIVVVGLIALAWKFPSWGPIALASTIVFCMMRFYNKSSYPFFVPKYEGGKDPFLRDPKTGGPGQSAGIFYFGSTDDRREAWFPDGVMRQHFFFLSTTGGGKTFSMSSVLINTIFQGSGFIYVDGKGEAAVAHRIKELARMCGREDDVLVINLMSGNKETYRQQGPLLSNTSNPFADGSSSTIGELLKSLLSGGDGVKGGDMWKTRAESLLDALVRVLVFLRDEGVQPLNALVIANSMDLAGIASVMAKANAARDRLVKEGRYVPTSVFGGLRNYLAQLPGVSEGQVEMILAGQMPDFVAQQNMLPYEQHSYVTMQIAPVMNMLAFDYGHIFNDISGDVDWWDCVIRRRIVVVLLPVLEKSAGAVSGLGKIQIAALRGMMARALGNQIEGEVKKLAKARPTASSEPYVIFFDEIGYYLVQGTASMLAQARSLGFSIGMGAQDVNAMEKQAPEEARAAMGNTNIKLYGKIEDPEKTMDFIKKRVDEADIAHVAGYESSDGVLGDMNLYHGKSDVSIQRRSRISIRDLAQLGEGQAFLQYGDRLIKVDLMTAIPPGIGIAKTNVFLPVVPPSSLTTKAARGKYEVHVKRFESLLGASNGADTLVQHSKDIIVMSQGLKRAEERGLGALDGGITALAALNEQLAAMFDANRRQREAMRRRQLGADPTVVNAGQVDPFDLEGGGAEDDPYGDGSDNGAGGAHGPGEPAVLDELMNLYLAAVDKKSGSGSPAESQVPTQDAQADSGAGRATSRTVADDLFDQPAQPAPPAPRSRGIVTPDDYEEIFRNRRPSGAAHEQEAIADSEEQDLESDDGWLGTPEPIGQVGGDDGGDGSDREPGDEADRSSSAVASDDGVGLFDSVTDPKLEARRDMDAINEASAYPQHAALAADPAKVAEILRDLLGNDDFFSKQ